MDSLPCDHANAWCTIGFEVMSELLPDPHEYLHAVVNGHSTEHCPPVLNEGIAGYIDSLSPETASPAPAASGWPMLLSVPPYDKHEYVRASHFVSFLAETYGDQAVVDLCKSLPRVPSRSDWERVVESDLHITGDELLAEYDHYPLCTYHALQDRTASCSAAPEQVLDEAHPDFTIEADCGHPRATNDSWGTQRNARMHHVIDVPEDSWVRIEVEGHHEEVQLVLRECRPCSEFPVVVSVPVQAPTVAFLWAGTYEVALFFARDEPAVATLSWSSPATP